VALLKRSRRNHGQRQQDTLEKFKAFQANSAALLKGDKGTILSQLGTTLSLSDSEHTHTKLANLALN
jgi:hypothetical protein